MLTIQDDLLSHTYTCITYFLIDTAYGSYPSFISWRLVFRLDDIHLGNIYSLSVVLSD